MAISTDSFVTQKQLDHTRSELTKEISSLRHDMKKGFKEVDARFDGVESRLDKVEASQQRTQALVEEMKTQNQIVYDRVDSLNESIENVRTELKQDYQNIMDVLSKISAAQNK